MNVFYNAGRAAEQVDEYNWIYTSRAHGGSGICEDNPATTTCLAAPLDTATGYADHIVPLEARIALGHVLANDPRPHYVHQSNLAEDRIAYPVLDRRPRRLRGPVRGQRPAGEPADEGHRRRTAAPRRLAGRREGRPGHRLPHRRRRDRQGTGRTRGHRDRARGHRSLLPAAPPSASAYAGTVSGWIALAAGDPARPHPARPPPRQPAPQKPAR